MRGLMKKTIVVMPVANEEETMEQLLDRLLALPYENLFVYPVIVAFIMTLFFHEKLTATTIVSILCAFFGVALLNYAGGMHTGGKFLGFIFSAKIRKI